MPQSSSARMMTNKKLKMTPLRKKKIEKVMREYKKGELNIGKSKKKVRSRKQAVAISLSVARKLKK